MFVRHSLSLDHLPQKAPQRGAELRIAALSQELLPLMRRHDLALHFSAPTPTGLCIADATHNQTNAYKIRGALAAVAEARREGRRLVITASAGNHGAGVALAARMESMKALVFVPESAPEVKVEKIRSFGATIVQAGETFDDALALAMDDFRLEAGEAAFIHPFDSTTVAAGQGTIGLEILDHLKYLACHQPYERVRLFLPVGGGGLLAGVASTVKTLWDSRLPQPEIVGVIDESSPAALLGTLFGRPVAAVPDTIADGTKVALIGETFLSVAHLVDHMMLVRHDEIVSAMRRHERATGLKLEGAGALALAGEELARRHGLFSNRLPTLSLAVVTGRNIDPDVFDRELATHRRLDTTRDIRQAFDIRIPERDGELLHFLRTVERFNIASLTYKQRPGTSAGNLRAEFEISRDAVAELHGAVMKDFPGSRRLDEGHEMLYRIGAPVASAYHDELITLDDQPGSFKRCVEALTQAGSFGSVGFVFYRKHAQAGRRAQVVLGRHRTTANEA